ncbi:MAG: HDOD domain-containing protein [Planctomycetes bacterium]|nr:HDOD domain-containing protein [Planctomycetota bacterium]
MEGRHGFESASANGAEPVDPLSRIRRRVQSLGALPTLPTIAQEVLRIANDPASSMGDISRVVERDPPLASRVLKVANSAFYGLSRKVGSLNLALVLLGMKKVSHLVAGVAIFRAVEDSLAGRGIPRERFWAHSVSVSHVAAALGGRLGIRSDGEEFVGGLLHDIGKIVIDVCFHEEFLEVVRQGGPDGEPGYELERRMLGVDHGQVGRWVGEKWNLPGRICEAIGLHHEPPEATMKDPLAALLQTSDAIARIREPGIASGPVIPPEAILLLPLLRARGAEAEGILTDILAQDFTGVQDSLSSVPG